MDNFDRFLLGMVIGLSVGCFIWSIKMWLREEVHPLINRFIFWIGRRRK